MRPQRFESLEVPIGNCTLLRTESGAELMLGNGKSFSITLPESSILHKLMQHQGEVVVKDDLILEAWGSAEIIGPNSLPVAITNLRKVLEIDNIKILNVPKKGYRISIPKPETMEKEKSNHELNRLVHTKDRTKPTSSVFTREVSKHESIPAYCVILICLYIIFYWWLSWVRIECKPLNESQICYIEGDVPNLQSLDITKPGSYYYSSNSGLINLEVKENTL